MNRLAGTCLCLAAALLAGAGCQEGPRTYPVTGTVSFDGQPVPDGDILFVGAGGVGPAHGKITNGRFELRAVAGVHRVEVRAAREARGLPGPMGPTFEDYVPARYNSHSTLTREVVPGGANHFDFPLEGDKK